MVVHIVTIDLRQKGLSFLVTPGDPGAELPLTARTTSQFRDEFDLQLAVNGDGFTPWRSNPPLDYYPHAGDRVKPNGMAASLGKTYSENPYNQPVLYISRTNQASFNTPIGKVFNAISGNTMLLEKGKSTFESITQADKEKGIQLGEPADPGVPQPRTAIGLDKRGRKLVILLVDGRQPGYSEGATLKEMAEMMANLGMFNAMNLDGGGSSTLVRQGADGNSIVLNSPIDQQTRGRERFIGNHLGIYAQQP
jgi:exopolysaccharide biosynthesis protein